MRKLRRLSARSAQKAKGKFLAAYAKLGNCSAAAEATGINRHHHKYWMAKSAEYREAFAAADDEATEALEKEARRRALEGREEPVYWNGQQVGTVRKYSDVLLIFLLKAKKPDIYREVSSKLTVNNSLQASVKVVHEYHSTAPAVDVYDLAPLPSNRLLGPTELPTITPDKAGGTAADSTPQPLDKVAVPVLVPQDKLTD